MGYRQIFAAVTGASISMSGVTAAICQQRPRAVDQRHDGVYALDIFTVLAGQGLSLDNRPSRPTHKFARQRLPQAVGDSTADAVVSLAFSVPLESPLWPQGRR